MTEVQDLIHIKQVDVIELTGVLQDDQVGSQHRRG